MGAGVDLNAGCVLEPGLAGDALDQVLQRPSPLRRRASSPRRQRRRARHQRRRRRRGGGPHLRCHGRHRGGGGGGGGERGEERRGAKVGRRLHVRRRRGGRRGAGRAPPPSWQAQAESLRAKAPARYGSPRTTGRDRCKLEGGERAPARPCVGVRRCVRPCAVGARGKLGDVPESRVECACARPCAACDLCPLIAHWQVPTPPHSARASTHAQAGTRAAQRRAGRGPGAPVPSVRSHPCRERGGGGARTREGSFGWTGGKRADRASCGGARGVGGWGAK